VSFGQLLGHAAPGWQGRIKEGAYTSPLGVRVPFQFTEVSRETAKRTAEFEFAGLDDAYIQDNGHGARRYPIRAIFTGDDHDRLATSFEANLLEHGAGQLEHPLYGTFAVVPVGTITRRNDLVNEANQSVVEVTFSTTLATIYPSGQGFPVSEILSAVDGFDLAAALNYESTARLSTVVQQATGKSTIRALMRETRSAFAEISGITAESRRSFADQQNLINEGIDTFIGTPLLLAQQIIGLVQAPAKALEGYASRLAGYRLMIDRLIASFAGSSTAPDLPNQFDAAVNAFRSTDLFLTSAVSGSVISITDTVFETRPQAIAAAEEVLDQLADVIEWRDGRLDVLGEIDTGESYQAIQDAVARAAGFLVEQSFSLIPERRIVLGKARTVLDLCAELYKTTAPERLDFLINSNDLSGDEILELPRGRELVFYI
jgi:hypothetical protein